MACRHVSIHVTIHFMQWCWADEDVRCTAWSREQSYDDRKAIFDCSLGLSYNHNQLSCWPVNGKLLSNRERWPKITILPTAAKKQRENIQDNCWKWTIAHVPCMHVDCLPVPLFPLQVSNLFLAIYYCSITNFYFGTLNFRVDFEKLLNFVKVVTTAADIAVGCYSLVTRLVGCYGYGSQVNVSDGLNSFY